MPGHYTVTNYAHVTAAQLSGNMQIFVATTLCKGLFTLDKGKKITIEFEMWVITNEMGPWTTKLNENFVDLP